MKITLNYEHGGNGVVSAAISFALDCKVAVKLQWGCISFIVDEWSTFLNIMCHAYAGCSRLSDSYSMTKVYNVSVQLEDGRIYSTRLWYDSEYNGLRYVSLH